MSPHQLFTQRAAMPCLGALVLMAIVVAGEGGTGAASAETTTITIGRPSPAS